MTQDPSTSSAASGVPCGDASYEGYRAWKRWDELFQPQPHECALYDREFRDLPVRGKRLLDIGFGSGALLGWAQQAGASIAGIEVQPELRDAALARGINVFDDLAAVPEASHDLVTAFDVLEHVPREHLLGFLAQTGRIADRDARIVFRFPNCQSAAGLLNQFGDPTHVTMLSGPIVAQLCRQAGLEIVAIREAVDPTFPTPFPRKLLRPVQRLLQKLHRLALRVLYSSGATPLTANVIVIAKV